MSGRLLARAVAPHPVLERMGAPHRPALGVVFDVLVWNVYKGRRRRWLADLGRLAGDADLVLLQEATLRESSRDYFHTDAAHEWIMARGFTSRLRQEVIGLKTGGAVAAEDAHVYLSPAREPVVRTPKLILVTRYPMAAGPPLLVLNIHAINFVSTARFGEQLAQMNDVIAGHTGPVILGGDFNTWSRSRKDVLRNLIVELGLEQVAFNSRGRLRHLARVLDHVFYRGLTVERHAVLTDVGSSDHRPLTVRFALAAEPTAPPAPPVVPPEASGG